MKHSIAYWALSWADLIDVIVEILSFGLVFETQLAGCVMEATVDAFVRAGWLDLGDAEIH